MLKASVPPAEDLNPQETAEWLQALDQVVSESGPTRASFLLDHLANRARVSGAAPSYYVNTPYVNTIPVEEQVPYPGDRALERRLKSLIRWNALAMVVRANKYDHGLGGHISTYARSPPWWKWASTTFSTRPMAISPGICLFPGARLAGRLLARLPGGTAQRKAPRELPSRAARTPRPVLVPASLADAGFLAVSDSLDGAGADQRHLPGALHALLGEAGAAPANAAQGLAFLGDGETDEPESTGALRIAANEKLDNLIFVVNCNLQRLDGPVRATAR